MLPDLLNHSSNHSTCIKKRSIKAPASVGRRVRLSMLRRRFCGVFFCFPFNSDAPGMDLLHGCCYLNEFMIYSRSSSSGFVSSIRFFVKINNFMIHVDEFVEDRVCVALVKGRSKKL